MTTRHIEALGSATFPLCHFHNGSEINVSESYLSAVPEEALREFLTFVRTTLGATARDAS